MYIGIYYIKYVYRYDGTRYEVLMYKVHSRATIYLICTSTAIVVYMYI